MIEWIVFASLAGLFFGSYNVFMKLVGEEMTPSVGLMIVSGTTFLIASVVTMLLKLKGQSVVFANGPALFAIMAGVSTGVAEILYLIMFSKGGGLSIGTPLVIAITSAVAFLIGIVLFRESVSVIQIVGFVLIVTGILFLMKGGH